VSTGASDLLFLNRADVMRLGIGMGDVVAAVDDGLREKGLGRVVMPPKSSLHGEGGAFCQAMAAWLPSSGSLGAKWVAIFPQNRERGIPVVDALVVLSDARDGRPVAVVEGGPVTAWRTGASAALAARYLARSDVDRVGVVGCGVQAEASVAALEVVLPELASVRCFDIVPAAATAFVEGIAGRRADLDARACRSPEEVTRGAGVVVSAITMSDAPPPLGRGLLEEGALAVALDYDAAWAPEAMAGCDRFFCDDVDQVLATRAAGERLQHIPASIAGDLGQLAAGHVPGRHDQRERLFCLNLGLALEDVVTARLVVERARERGVGTLLPR
jgi:ornithine cyclodeaminase/alanine dehydrogenase-like protein (mu-crystallin family)